jgi:DNA polymerase III alpha subunit (gram-positive type)
MYAFIDTETGGLDARIYSLLSISIHMVRELGQPPIAVYHEKILHDPYRIGAGALNVNKIDLIQHSKNAVTIDDARHGLRSWLALFGSNQRIRPVGWNIPFDMNFIYEQLFPKREWESLGFSYHTLDVCALVEFLILQGKLPEKRRLVDVAKHFGFDTDGAHDASFDNQLCQLVLQELLKL